jgi:hypothetical protein
VNRDVIARVIDAQELDARDDPRGEFIRVQCALRGRLGVGDFHELRAIEAELLMEHLTRWLGTAVAVRAYRGVFREGSLDDLGKVPVDLFVQHAEAIFAEHPVRRVNLQDVDSDSVEALRSLACMAQLTHLSIEGRSDGRPGDTILERLSTAPWLSSIESLRVAYSRFSATGVAALASSEALVMLRELGLRSCRLDDDSARALSGETSLGRCQVLHLTDNNLTDAGAEALAHNTGLRSLRVLSLGKNLIADAGVAALASSEALVTLRKLDLHGNNISDEGARSLAGSVALASLESVDLYGCYRFEPATLRALEERFRVVVYGSYRAR